MVLSFSLQLEFEEPKPTISKKEIDEHCTFGNDDEWGRCLGRQSTGMIKSSCTPAYPIYHEAMFIFLIFLSFSLRNLFIIFIESPGPIPGREYTLDGMQVHVRVPCNTLQGYIPSMLLRFRVQKHYHTYFPKEPTRTDFRLPDNSTSYQLDT